MSSKNSDLTNVLAIILMASMILIISLIELFDAIKNKQQEDICTQQLISKGVERINVLTKNGTCYEIRRNWTMSNELYEVFEVTIEEKNTDSTGFSMYFRKMISSEIILAIEEGSKNLRIIDISSTGEYRRK